jgi:hypothetical protein
MLFYVQSTAHQTIHFGLCTALISTALALILNCKYIALRAVDRMCIIIILNITQDTNLKFRAFTLFTSPGPALYECKADTKVFLCMLNRTIY